MKKILGLVVIIAALVLGGYFGMGLITERTLKKNIEIVNQSTGFTVKIAQYDRHWFYSTAAVDVVVHVPEQTQENQDGKIEKIPAKDYTLNLPVNIIHGPIIYTGTGVVFGLGYAKSDLTLPKELVDKVSTYFAAQSTLPTLKLSVFVDYRNKSRFQLAVPGFKLMSKEGENSAEWLGLTGDIDVSSDLKNISGDFSLDGIKVLKDKMNGELGKVTSDYALHKTDDGLYVGYASVLLPSLLVTEDGKTLFDVSQFKIHTENSVDKGLFESDFKTSVDKVLSKDKQYGPGLLELSVKNLDAKVLARLNAQVNKIKHTSGAERQQTMFAMLPELPKLLAQGASFEISALKLTVPEGDIDGHFTIALPKTEAINPFQIMQQIEGNGKFVVPSAIVKRVVTESLKQKNTAQNSLQSAVLAEVNKDQPVQENKESTKETATAAPDTAAADQQAAADADTKIAALLQSKILIVDGQNYQLEFHLSKGKLTVNGQPFDPATFKF